MKILIIEDSPLARTIIIDILKNLDFIEEIETARNGKIGLEIIQKKNFDLILLDVEMPVMDGITFLKEKKKIGNQTTTIMLSAFTQEGAEITLKALELGAIDFIQKPHDRFSLEEIKIDLINKITSVYSELTKSQTRQKEIIKHDISPTRKLSEFEIILIGSSTGGPKSISSIVRNLTLPFPLPIAIVQHMPEYFTATFANRLSQLTSFRVFEAENGRNLNPEEIVVAKGNKHLLFTKNHKNQFSIILSDEEKINAHRPSVDKTLINLIELTQGKVICILLTGMGRDGVEACKLLKKKGGFVIAQDESTSTIFGMNKRAIEENAVDIILPDYKIADYLMEMKEF